MISSNHFSRCSSLDSDKLPALKKFLSHTHKSSYLTDYFTGLWRVYTFGYEMDERAEGRFFAIYVENTENWPSTDTCYLWIYQCATT